METKKTEKNCKCKWSFLYTIWNHICGLFGEDDRLMSAEEAYYRTRYGAYHTLEQRIKEYQREIRALIRYKAFPGACEHGEMRYSSCYCVTELDEDIAPHAEEIFKPFVEAGYNITDLGGITKDFETPFVFLVSWHRKSNPK